MVNKARAYLPEWSKIVLRLLSYKEERKKFLIERKVREIQDKELPKFFAKDCKKLIVFVVPGTNWFTGEDEISGGILSIASIYQETLKLKEIHQAEVIMVTEPGAYLLFKHTKFENDIPVFRFEQLFYYFECLEDVLFHIPELMVLKFVSTKSNRKLPLLARIRQLHINILNQNIRLMPEPAVVAQLKRIASVVTQTTAHEKYTTPEIREKWDVPLHHFSVFGSPEKYKKLVFSDKEQLLVVSPDVKPQKEEVLSKVQAALGNYRQVLIRNMPYQVYLQTIAKAKFALTFGEGLDFYFLETVFSGGIGVAVYNEEFFPKDWQHLPGIFSSYEELNENIVGFLKKTHKSAEAYYSIQEQQYAACSALYSYKDYQENILKFYLKEYQFA